MMEIWEKPQMNEVEFVASEYVTTCANTALSDASGYFALETNGQAGMQYGEYDDSLDGSVSIFSGDSYAYNQVFQPDNGFNNYSDYLAHALNASREDGYEADQMIFLDDGSTNLWTNECGSDAHSPVGSTTYDGYFHAGTADNSYGTGLTNTWTNVTIWFQEATGILHAVLAGTARS